MIGRTHGVHAEPMSLGAKFAYWWDELSRAGDALAVAVGGASVGKLSGAVGTYANIDPRVEEIVCEALGIRAADVSNQIVSRDRHAAYLNALAVLGSVIARQALEIRLEFDEHTEIRDLGDLTLYQVANLVALVTEVEADMAAFMKYLGVDELKNLPERDYDRAVAALEHKRQ